MRDVRDWSCALEKCPSRSWLISSVTLHWVRTRASSFQSWVSNKLPLRLETLTRAAKANPIGALFNLLNPQNAAQLLRNPKIYPHSFSLQFHSTVNSSEPERGGHISTESINTEAAAQTFDVVCLVPWCLLASLTGRASLPIWLSHLKATDFIKFKRTG